MKLPINYDDDLILYSEDGVTWHRYRAWLALVYANHPERLRDAPSPAQGGKEPETAAEADRRERAEAKTWRAGRGQGILARTSPLAAERRDYWSGEHHRKEKAHAGGQSENPAENR